MINNHSYLRVFSKRICIIIYTRLVNTQSPCELSFPICFVSVPSISILSSFDSAIRFASAFASSENRTFIGPVSPS